MNDLEPSLSPKQRKAIYKILCEMHDRMESSITLVYDQLFLIETDLRGSKFFDNVLFRLEEYDLMSGSFAARAYSLRGDAKALSKIEVYSRSKLLVEIYNFFNDDVTELLEIIEEYRLTKILRKKSTNRLTH